MISTSFARIHSHAFGMALRLKGGAPLPEVGDILAVGTCDVSGAGVLALLGLVPVDGVEPVVHELEIVSLALPGSDESEAGAVFVPHPVDHDSKPTPSVSLVQIGSALSLLVVNEQVREADEAAFAAAVHAMSTGGKTCKRVFIIGALRLDEKARGAKDPLVFEFGGESISQKTENDAQTIRDGALAALVHVMRSTSTPTTCMFIPGHKVVGLGNDVESESEREAAEVANMLGAAAAGKLNEKGASVKYDTSRVSAYRAARNWRPASGAAENTDRMYT